MKFVILSNKPLPMYNGVHGPILTPAEYDVHLVLKFIAYGIDVREVMEDGSYRKLEYNDAKLIELLKEKNKESIEKLEERRNMKYEIEEIRVNGNVRLKEERKQRMKEEQLLERKNRKEKEDQQRKEEHKQRMKEDQQRKEERKQHEVKKEETKQDLIIDDLEKPE